MEKEKEETQEVEKVDNETSQTTETTDVSSTNEEQPVKTYTQEEVDAMVGKAKHKEKEKQKTNATAETLEKQRVEDNSPKKEATPTATTDSKVTIDVRAYQVQVAQAEIKVALATQGVDTSKLHRIARLIDAENVLGETGEVNPEALNKEIETLLSEWPELKNATNTASFVIGNSKETSMTNTNDDIARAFGNKK